MIIGAAYYPEHWNKERWITDCKLMQEMGINTVRMAEFGWSVMEREEGSFDFSLYDEAIGLLGEYGISVILGTPAAAPPAWLCEKYPDIYMEDRDGHIRGFGSRRHYCYRHKGYRKAVRKITEEMVKHYQNDSRVVAWQIDNELGCEDEVRCYCEDCRKGFIQWLKEKYGTLDALNMSWGTVFWSQTYTKWEQIVLPKKTVVDPYTGNGHNPGLLLDFAEFSSDSLIDFAGMQCETVRSLTKQPVIHNMVSEFCDNYKLAELLDGVGYDAYPRSEWDCNSPGRIGFHYDLTRGYDQQKPFWILEQQSGPCGWNVLGRTPRQGQLALWSIQGAARAAKGLLYFRWRTCLFGTEQLWYGILDHDGVPGRRYLELKNAVSEMKKYESVFSLPQQKQVLLLYDYRNKFSFEFQPHAKGFVYKEEVIRYYEDLLKLHLSVDVGGVKTDFDSYSMVVFPFADMADDYIVQKLEKYVRTGGILVLTVFSGRREMNHQMTERELPGRFRELAGVSVKEFDSLKGETKRLIWNCIDRNINAQDQTAGTAHLWCEMLHPESAETIAYYSDSGGEDRSREAAITVNSFGKGKVYYIGALLEDYRAVLTEIADGEKLERPMLPEEIECLVKENGEYMVLLNHGQNNVDVFLKGYEPEKISLKAFDTKILKRSR